MCGLSDAIVGLVSAILGGEEPSLTSEAGLFLSWTTGSSGEVVVVVVLATTGSGGSTVGGDVEIDEEEVWF